jgi:hypothetical protein
MGWRPSRRRDGPCREPQRRQHALHRVELGHRSPGRRGSHPVPSLTLSAPTAQGCGRVRPSRRASVVRQPPWDPTEKGLCVDYPAPAPWAGPQYGMGRVSVGAVAGASGPSVPPGLQGDHRDAPSDVPRADGRGGRDRRLTGIRAARVRGIPQVWPPVRRLLIRGGRWPGEGRRARSVRGRGAAIRARGVAASLQGVWRWGRGPGSRCSAAPVGGRRDRDWTALGSPGRVQPARGCGGAGAAGHRPALASIGEPLGGSPWAVVDTRWPPRPWWRALRRGESGQGAEPRRPESEARCRTAQRPAG